MKFMTFFFAIPLLAFIALTPPSPQAAEVQLGWNRPAASADFVRYKIYWGEESGSYTQSQEIGQHHSSITITDLQPGKTYYFVSTTVNAAGDESPYSPEIEVAIPASAHASNGGDVISDPNPSQGPSPSPTEGNGHTDAGNATTPPDSTPPSPETTDPSERVFLMIESAHASAEDDVNLADHTIDGDLGTAWATEGDGQWIVYDIGVIASVAEVAIAWVNGDRDQASFTIETSVDGAVWSEALSTDSRGTTLELESYVFAPQPARYIRIVGYGNSSDLWNEIAEVELYGQYTPMRLPVQSARASHVNRPHLPANTVDGNLRTRWSAEGDGQWIMYDLGGLATVSEVAIAWAQGDRRTASFTLEVSLDGRTWQEVYSGDSSGTTSGLETYGFPPVSARHVLLVGYGNSENLWTNIAEAEIRGYMVDAEALEQKTVGGRTYTVQLAVEDNFETLDNWLIDMPHPDTVSVSDNTLHWDALDTLGTLWHKTRIEGPSIIEYDVQTLAGKRNINGIFYGSIMDQGQETLLEARRGGDGVYRDYQHFHNYMVTYLDPEQDGVWRIRFRENPGFNLVKEQFKRHPIDANDYQRITYVFEADGTMRLYVDGRRMQVYKDQDDVHRQGHHALRIFETLSNYKNFRIYKIVPDTQ